MAGNLSAIRNAQKVLFPASLSLLVLIARIGIVDASPYICTNKLFLSITSGSSLKNATMHISKITIASLAKIAAQNSILDVLPLKSLTRLQKSL